MNVFPCIIRREDNVIILKMNETSERSAERTLRGASINLNHDEFYTKAIPVNEINDWEVEE